MFAIWLRLRNAFLLRWWRALVPAALRSVGVQLGRGVTFYGWPEITLSPGSRVVIGDAAVLCSDRRFTALGVARPVLIRTLSPAAEVSIGRDTGISGGVICAARSVRIGAECLFGADVLIADTDFHALDPVGRRHESRAERIASAPIVIGDNVFLGAGVRVLKGVSIGRDAVVGAGSIVTRDVPAGAIAAGVPAKVIGSVYPAAAETASPQGVREPC